MPRPVRLLFVCMGNICRSPAAEGIARSVAAEQGLPDGHLEIDSAGTLAYHAGEPPDQRMQTAGAARGYALDGRARPVTGKDLRAFDWVVAMDRDNLADLRELQSRGERPGERQARLALLSDFLPDGSPLDVPDPYYGGSRGFERVLDLLEAAMPRLFEEVLGGWPPT